MSEEYVSRTAALTAIFARICRYPIDSSIRPAYEDALEAIGRLPPADVAPVVHGNPITKIREVTISEYHEAHGVFASDGSNVYIKNMVHAKIPYDHCPACGAVLCSRWHNYCGKCGARMDGAEERSKNE